jgi:hypothetical protein
MNKAKLHIFLVVACLVLLLTAPQARAGFFDDLSKAAGQVADQIKKDAKSVGQDIGVVTAAKKKAGTKLPGGVANRLRKINQELDRAEKAMGKGNRAQLHLKKADRLKQEIEKRYAGKYDPEHPDVTACYGRLEEMRQSITAAAQKADQAEQAAKQQAEQKKQAEAEAQAQVQAAEQSKKQQAAQAAQDAKALCGQWNKRLEQFTQGDKALHAYSTKDEAQINKWKGYYDEAKQARAELDASGLDKSKCFGLASTERLLNTYMTRFEDFYTKHQASLKERGSIVFSKSPINPKSPAGLTDSFQAGDHIYALVQASKPWSKYFRKEGNLRINVSLDGKKLHAQFILLRKPEDLSKNYAVLEIAPDPGSMISYSGKLPEYGKSSANMMQGPMELCHHLGKLGPGKHTMSLETVGYSINAKGSFSIEGSGYDFYAGLGEKVSAAAAKTVVMPQAQMINKSLEAKMRGLLKNAGWEQVYRLNIKDKNWWIERISGGDSPIKARYLNVAAMCQDGQGYFYRICIFHQDRLINGAWGELYLSHQGNKVRVLAGNKDK